MTDNKSIINTIRSQLMTTFETKEWSHIQYETYKLIKQYVDSLKEENRIYEIRDDKMIIRNNFKEQSWFNYSKSKPIIGHLLDMMKMVNYMFDHNEYCLNFNVVLSFDHFQLNGCLYKNYVNGFVNFYIFIENDKHQKAYLTYYTQSPGIESSNDIKKLKLPEFDKIYQIINIGQNIFYQCDLLNFFSEIIMYYDESGTIGDLPIGFNLNVTLNQLIEKFNTYMAKKRTENDYKVVT